MIGRKAEEVLNRAVQLAFEKQHEYFTLEHVLLSLLEEPEILDAIDACGANEEELHKKVEDYLDRDVPKRPPPKVNPAESTEEEDILHHPVATLSIQRMIQRALFHVQSAGKDEILPEDLFIAIFQSKDSFALNALTAVGISKIDALNYFSHGTTKNDSDDDETGLLERTPTDKTSPAKINKRGPMRQNNDPLENYTVNLNKLAKKGEIDPLIGRVQEVERVIQTLSRRRKNNPLLVGEAGVGKTAIAEGLALRIVNKEVPSFLESSVVYSLDMGSLLAGTKFRGDFEQRLKKVIKAISDQKEKGIDPILMIDEIHTIIGAGAVGGGTMDAANLLKPALARGDLRCIGSTTYLEYRNIFEKDHALSRRFQKIDVKEPNQEEAIQILQGLKKQFEAFHQVKYTDDSIRSAVELSQKHITDRFLPDKAIDVLDEVGARAKIKNDAHPEQEVVVDSEAVEEIVAKIARIPERSVSVNQKKRLQNMSQDLKLAIFGQDHAVAALVKSIHLARSGLRTGDKPVGAFLFCGPTGVGKTELSKQLAHCLGIHFARFDMSEYMEKHTVARLIGAPPGYVGFEQAGLLTDTVAKHPHSVILLDEIEKSHSDVWNILLQVMDHGTLTDSNGKKADFRNTIIIMTSNVGSREMERRQIGLGSTSGGDLSVAKREVERAFSPEFRNRLDSIIYFNPLDPVTIGQIVGKQLIELESQLSAKGVEIQVETDVREWLAKKGFDPKMGARPLARIIQDQIKVPLSEEILFGKLQNGGEVVVKLKKDKPSFKFKASPKKDKDVETVSVSGGSKNKSDK